VRHWSQLFTTRSVTMQETYKEILFKGSYLLQEDLFLDQTLLENCLRYNVITSNDLIDLSNDTKFYVANNRFYRLIRQSIAEDKEEKGPPKRFSLFLTLMYLMPYHHREMLSNWKLILRRHDKKCNKDTALSKFWYRLLQKGQRLIKKQGVQFTPISETAKSMVIKIHETAEAGPPQRPRIPNRFNYGVTFVEYMRGKYEHLFQDDMHIHPRYGDATAKPLSIQDRKDIRFYRDGFERFLLYKSRDIGMTLMAQTIFRDQFTFPDISHFNFKSDREGVRFILKCVCDGYYASFLRLFELIYYD